MERYYQGKNYHFFVPHNEGSIAVASAVEPFYSFPPERIPALPALISESLAVPGFLYKVTWEGNQRSPGPIHLPGYIQYEPGRLTMAHVRFPPGSYLHQVGGKIEIKGGGCRVSGKPPFLIDQGEWATQIGAVHPNGVRLFYRYRRHIEAAEYISLRDMVNPQWDHEAVYRAVDELSLANRLKQGLFRLIKILYAGDAGGEIGIVRNIYSREPEFARLIYEALFNIEVVPLIHGPFLQKILSGLEDETIAAGFSGISPALQQAVRKSVSKNRFRYIEDLSGSRIKKPAQSLVQIIELAIAKKFARRILFEPVHTQEKESAEVALREKLFVAETSGDFMHEQSIVPYESAHINLTCRPLNLRIFAASTRSIFIQVLRPLDYLRFDYWHNNYSWSERVFINLRNKTIVEAPYSTSDKAIVGAGITRGGFPVEFQILVRDV